MKTVELPPENESRKISCLQSKLSQGEDQDLSLSFCLPTQDNPPVQNHSVASFILAERVGFPASGSKLCYIPGRTNLVYFLFFILPSILMLILGTVLAWTQCYSPFDSSQDFFQVSFLISRFFRLMELNTQS